MKKLLSILSVLSVFFIIRPWYSKAAAEEAILPEALTLHASNSSSTLQANETSLTVDNKSGKSLIDLGKFSENHYVLTFSFTRLSSGDGSFSFLYRMNGASGHELRLNMLQYEPNFQAAYYGSTWPEIDGNAIENRFIGDLNTETLTYTNRINDFNYYSEEFAVDKEYHCRIVLNGRWIRLYVNETAIFRASTSDESGDGSLMLLFDDPIKVKISNLTRYSTEEYAESLIEDMQTVSPGWTVSESDEYFEKICDMEQFIAENFTEEELSSFGAYSDFTAKTAEFRKYYAQYFPILEITPEFEETYEQTTFLMLPTGQASDLRGRRIALNAEVYFDGKKLAINDGKVCLNETGTYTVVYYAVDYKGHRTEVKYSFSVTEKTGSDPQTSNAESQKGCGSVGGTGVAILSLAGIGLALIRHRKQKE